MNTFFISPVIPLKIYLTIQKEKSNVLLDFNDKERIFIGKINQLFNYSNELTYDTMNIIISIVDKISTLDKYANLSNKLSFTNLNTYKEITNYNYIFYELLIDRNYVQIINPYKYKTISMTVGLSDIGPISDININLFNQLEEVKKYEFIDDIIKTKTTKSKFISHNILSKSRVDSKINTITRILSNKSILYSILKDEDFIPSSDSFMIGIDDYTLNNIISTFKKNIKSDYFVIKPSAGSLSDGIGIFKKEILTLEFVKNWIRDIEHNKYAQLIGDSQQYPSWILSEFIQSFLWKLQGQNKTSQVFPKLESIEPSIKFNFNDTSGRINKFRFWSLWTIIDNQFTSYLYKDGYVEMAIEELTNYSKAQLDPSNIEEYYNNLLNIEENPNIFEKIQEQNGPQNDEEQKIEASTVGTYLDFARVVNETNFPLGSEVWNNVLIPGMYSIINRLSEKIKRFLTCMNKYSIKNNKGCFSYFALDIIVDANGKPWLLEANSRPFVGFSDYWNKYDPYNEHCVNVKNFLDTVISLTTDIINGSSKPIRSIVEDKEKMLNNYSKFVITSTHQIINRRKIYVPLSLGIYNTGTNKVYDEFYNILDSNKYDSFPYPQHVKNLNTTIGFRGMSPISKYLLSQIQKLGKDEYLSIMKELFPYDSKMQIINRISTLGFYLGDKSIMTKMLKENTKNWETIIPYSIILESNMINQKFKNELLNKLNNFSGKIIAKPAYGQQGLGIIISDSKEHIIDEIFKKEKTDWVISKYLDDPYLIKLNKSGVSGINYNDTIGRKSHLRAYVLLIREKDELKVYIYKKSLIFCAAKEYNSCNKESSEDLNDKNNSKYCNLTNLYYGSLYYKEILNKDSGDAYKDLSMLTDLVIPKNEYVPFMNTVKNIIKSTIIAVQDDLICLNEPNKCFQHIAFDLHLENDMSSGKLIPKPWLLEVNSTPGLKAPSYQWENMNKSGLNNYLESILNLVVKTKISKGNKQLFEYLPLTKKINTDEFDLSMFDNIKKCSDDNKYIELKQILTKLQIPGRSKLTTKLDMCKTLEKFSIKRKL